MRLIKDMGLTEFKAWSEGKVTKDHLTLPQLQQLDRYFSLEYPEGISENALNDFLRYERDCIAKILEFADWNDLINKNK